jgi:hypothetical protein
MGAAHPSIVLPMRLICSLLALVAVLLMPLGMNAAAAAPSTSHHDMAGMGHCPDQGSQSESTPGIAACTMICAAALPAADAGMPGCAAIAALPAEVTSIRVLAGLHPDAADPPPKLA